MQLLTRPFCSTLVFNAFVFCQVFNQLNARKLGRDLNVLTDIHKNMWFLTIFAISAS